ncbi:hypothetical protein Tco_1280963 [Tanacetum coccineum]
MDTTKAQQQALDDELVAPADYLKIGKSNPRLSSTLKSKEPTLQVVLDALKLTSFYNAFGISTDVPKIYMQEFWVTISRHHSSLRFKLNGKSHSVNVENFRDMLNIFPKLTVISKHQDTQVYDAILPQHFTNQAMLESEAYMTYQAYATGEKTPKPKNTKKKANFEASPKTKTTQATKGKRIKSLAKGDKAAKKKKPAETSTDKGLLVLSDVALTEAEQLKMVIKRSKTQTHNSHASGSGADEGTCDIPGVPDVLTYGSDGEQISWKSSEEDDEDEVNVNEENQDDDDDEQTDSDNDGDDFVHPKFSTYDDEARQEEVNNEDSFDVRVQTPFYVESTNDESNEESDE